MQQQPMVGKEAGHGGQLINNAEGPKDMGGRYVQCPGPEASPSQALCWGPGILEGSGGEAEDQGRTSCPTTATRILPTS